MITYVMNSMTLWKTRLEANCTEVSQSTGQLAREINTAQNNRNNTESIKMHVLPVISYTAGTASWPQEEKYVSDVTMQKIPLLQSACSVIHPTRFYSNVTGMILNYPNENDEKKQRDKDH